MPQIDITPSETEWLVMEILWESTVPLTSMEIIKRLQNVKKMSPKTVRVLINRLYQKGIIDYTIDKKDARVYHYFAVKLKNECLQEKSRRFTESYFSGNKTNALAALIQNCDLTEEQINELEELLEKSKGSEDK
ncbi:MAG: BlaI/MecI/CopY family transcriptional regulator [Lachnospiraceae bacterium]|nr:BlaI/MecI/CopY family transcriptional regulator [Lachnospiraceae bacterium]